MRAFDLHLQALRAAGLERRLCEAEPDPQPGFLRLEGQRLLDLASNDYLGLSRQSWMPETALDALADHPARESVVQALHQYGAGASRLISGNHPLYTALERELAQLKGQEAALVFGSGYSANLGVLAALLGSQDAVFSDQLNHASIIDGIRLSRAQCQVFAHRDLDELARQLQSSSAPNKWIVTDALFSMDGTLAPLRELVALKRRFGARLMLDEAHSGGVYGPAGAGLAAELGLSSEIDVLMGTLSKAYGSLGAYIAGSDVLIRYLLNHSRSLIFTTALPPVNVAVSLLNVRRACGMDQERAQLHAQAARFRAALLAQGEDLAGSESFIVPLVIGGAAETTALAQQLQAGGYGVWAIRPPTVPEGQSRLRCSLSAVHRWQDLAGLLRALENVRNSARSSQKPGSAARSDQTPPA